MHINNNVWKQAGVFLVLVLAAYAAVAAFASAEAAPVLTATIRDASENVISSAPVGTNVHSVVKVSSSTTSTIPQGTVDFNVYQGTGCSGAATTQSNVALVNGNATSSATTVPVGGLSYTVHYDGDVNNVAGDTGCLPLTGVGPNAVTISTNLSASTIQAGASVHDTATLSGETANAGGTVTYTVFSNSSCLTPYGGAGIVSVVNGNVPDSPPFQFVTPGTYYWQAVYSGDAGNSAATSTCTSEILTVTAAPTKNSPTISTTLSTSSILTGTSVFDSSTLTSETANASGTVAYKVYTNNSCTSLFANAGTKTVVNGNVPNSDSVTFNSAGTYYWQASYSGDSENNAATSTCTSEVLTVGSPSSPPPAGAGTISGTVYHDKNNNDVRDAGDEGLPGFTVNLYEGPNWSGDYDPVFKTTTTDSNGNYSFSGLANATYSIEQLIKDGWKQTTDDYASVVISEGVGVSGRDFGNIEKKGAGKNCKEREDRGKHNGWHKKAKHKKDCVDQDNGVATSSKPWWRNSHDNGLHLGWFKDELTAKIHTKVEAKLKKAADRWEDD